MERLKILVYTTFGIGDALMANSILPFIRRHDVTYVGESLAVDLLEDDTWIRKIKYKRSGLTPMLRGVKERLKGQKFDWLILTVPSNNNEGKQLLNAITVQNVCHFEPSLELTIRSVEHTIEVNRKLVKEFLYQTQGELMDPITKVRLNNSTYHLGLSRKRFSIDERTKEVAMHVASKNWYWRNKAFPLKLFMEIAELLRSAGFKPIIVGDSHQRIAAMHLAPASDVFIGLPMRDLITIMGRAHAFVGNDCGPAHLAAALGTPTITFFGPTDPKMTAPWPLNSKKNIRVQGKVHCGPCYMQRTFIKCDDAICHDKVGIDDFYRAWRELEDTVYRGNGVVTGFCETGSSLRPLPKHRCEDEGECSHHSQS